MSISKSFYWSAVERFSNQIIQFVVGIILARLLGPSDYGIIGIILIINSFLQIFIDSGFTKALIQKQDRTLTDFNSVFIFNVCIGLFCYVLLFITSPLIENFYDINNLALYIRIVGLSLLINTFYAIIQIDFTIKLDFKSIAKVSLLSSFFSGTIAVIMAYLGYGIWALIIQILLKSLFTLLFFLFIREYKFKLVYNQHSIIGLYKFGSNILYGSLLNNLVNNFSTIFIGKIYNVQSVGYYTRGTQFTDVAYNTFNSILDSILLPVFSNISDNIDSIRTEFIKIYRFSVLILLPIFILLALLAEPIIKILLTDKWLMAVPIMQIFAVARFITLLSGININVLYALGQSRLALKQQMFKIVIRVFLLAIAIPFGIYYLALAELVSTILHYFVNTYYPGKIISFNAIRQISSCFKIFICSISFIIVFIVSLLIFSSDYLIILFTVLTGLVIYILLLKIMKVHEINIILKKIFKI